MHMSLTITSKIQNVTPHIVVEKKNNLKIFRVCSFQLLLILLFLFFKVFHLECYFSLYLHLQMLTQITFKKKKKQIAKTIF